MREICKSTVSQRYILTDIQKEYHRSRLVIMDRVHTRSKEENMTQDGPKVDPIDGLVQYPYSADASKLSC